MPSHTFRIGERYNRLNDIHGPYGGNRQSGISYGQNSPYVFLFTGGKSSSHGYSGDHWGNDGDTFLYTGEGQVGNMTMTASNRAILQCVSGQKSALLFESNGKGRPYSFLGEFLCSGYEEITMPDRLGEDRVSFVFSLQRTNEQPKSVERNLKALRDKAYAAAAPAQRTETRATLTSQLIRHVDIKDYVLERANGKCECCGEIAPFSTPRGTPYLEAHHVLRLADNGFDDPRYVAALTPNCHREIHFGTNGKERNEKLSTLIFEKETVLETI